MEGIYIAYLLALAGIATLACFMGIKIGVKLKERHDRK